MQRMIVTHKNACVVVNILESDRITVECHLVATGIIVKPKMVKTVSCSLAMVGRVTDIEHDRRLLTEEIFQNDGDNIKNLGIIRSMFVLTIVYEEMIGTIVHEDGVFIKAYCIMNVLIGYKTKSKLTQLTQLVG